MLSRSVRILSLAVPLLAATFAATHANLSALPSRNASATNGNAAAPPLNTPTPFVTASHRNPPLLPNHDANNKPCPPQNDCPSAKPLRIISIIPDSYPANIAKHLEQFSSAMLSSKWLKEFTAAYDIPGPTIAQVIPMAGGMPDLNSGQPKTNADFEKFIFDLSQKPKSQIKADPAHRTIYVLYIPCDDNGPGLGKSGGCKSHHPGIVLGSGQPWEQQAAAKLFSPGDSMAVILAFNPNHNPSAFTGDQATVPASHETAEAATDAAQGIRFNLHTDDPDHPYLDTGSNAGGSPWVREGGSIETADMSEGARWFEPGPGGEGPFEYERIYSNEKSKHGGDPAVPKSPFPYFNVSTEKDWFPGISGMGVIIPVTAWSTEDNGFWEVDASVARWLNQDKTPAATAPCSLSAKHWTVHNGSAFNVIVDTSAGQQSTNWCELRLKSKKDIPGGDDSHEWWVGVIIQPRPRPTPTPGESDACVCSDGFKAGPAARAGTEACAHICRGHEPH
jgi:hypothetical protein